MTQIQASIILQKINQASLQIDQSDWLICHVISLDHFQYKISENQMAWSSAKQ